MKLEQLIKEWVTLTVASWNFVSILDVTMFEEYLFIYRINNNVAGKRFNAWEFKLSKSGRLSSLVDCFPMTVSYINKIRYLCVKLVHRFCSNLSILCNSIYFGLKYSSKMINMKLRQFRSIINVSELMWMINGNVN